MRKTRLLIWLTVVLTILLLATIGVFVFLSLNAKYQFACLFECKQGEVVARKHGSSPTEAASVAAVYNVTTSSLKTASPEIRKSEKPTPEGKTRAGMTQKTTAFITIDNEVIRPRTSSKTSTTSAYRKTTSAPAVTRQINVKQSTSAHVVTPMSLHTTRKQRVNQKDYISISGNISFKGVPPKRFPRNSRLIVKFVDDSLADVSWTVLGKTVVNLSNRRRRKTLSYTVTCKRPEMVPEFDEFDSSYYYSVNAVLNVGWKKNKNNWLRRGDYFTDTRFGVHITKHKRLFVRNIQLVKYTY